MLWIDLPIFVATTASAAVFFLCAQRELYPKDWKRDIWFFPFVLALGIGLSINNARAVLEAIFNRRSDFCRTPKYGIEKAKQRWESSRYSAVRTVTPLVEFTFAGYFHILRISCFSKSRISVSTLSNVVSNWFRIRSVQLDLAAYDAAPVELTGHFRRLNQDGKDFCNCAISCQLCGIQPRSESLSCTISVGCSSAAAKSGSGGCRFACADAGAGSRDETRR